MYDCHNFLATTLALVTVITCSKKKRCLYTQMISLYRDPKGEEIFSDMDPSKRTEKSENKDNHNSMAASLSELKDSEKVVLLNSQVARLKETLNDKNKRIAELEGIVNSTN